MSGSESAGLGISNGMSGGRRLTCTPQGKVGSLSSSMVPSIYYVITRKGGWGGGTVLCIEF